MNLRNVCLAPCIQMKGTWFTDYPFTIIVEQWVENTTPLKHLPVFCEQDMKLSIV